VWEETVLPEGGTYHGHGGIDQWFAVAGGAFSEVAFTVETIAPAGGGLLVTHELRSRGTSSGLATQQRIHHAVRLRDGRVAYVGAFADEGRARSKLAPDR